MCPVKCSIPYTEGIEDLLKKINKNIQNEKSIWNLNAAPKQKSTQAKTGYRMMSVHTRHILAFVHIEKAAGTTLIHILRRNFLLRHFDVRPLTTNLNGGIEFNSQFSASDLNKTLRINPFLQCIAGHAIKPYGDIVEHYPSIRFITLMRNPIKRYVSHYQYWIEKMGRNVSFDEFLGLDEISNFQTKKISGTENLSQAKDILENNFFLVGIVEMFDEFLILLKNKLASMKFEPWYRIKNKAKNNKVSSQITEHYYDQIVQRNSVDIELYQFVKSQLVPQAQHLYGEAFGKDLEKFRIENESKSPAMFKSRLDYVLRKFYIEPVGGMLRLANGLPYKGSY